MVQIVFMGTPDFAVPTLEKLIETGEKISTVVTQPDRRQGRGKKLKPSPVKRFAQKNNFPVMQPEELNADAISQLEALAPDVIVVVAYGQLLPEKVLNIPTYGCLNVHASLLPKYRGAAPIHRAIINGEKESGVSIMRMERGMDTGPILAQRKVTITETMTTGELHDSLAEIGAQLLAETLAKIAEVSPVTQQDSEATYADKISKADEKLNWNRSAADIVNLVRGMNPWPGTYTTLEDKRLKIFDAELFPYRPMVKEKSNKCRPEPGMILEIVPTGIVVATGDDNAVLVTRVQPPGKQKMPTADFLRGYRIMSGHRFGDGDSDA
ncbi:methionyl-tRNA formyltransferase [Metallumcola ferriviriculae]|uniref:Methionyl-tRNA formyltransferase n=1 Tax=Metallumcola ferriviriculae TaxID=3039180 RepID=A0AAU0UPD4_9FIRM|nr:methionyl-tRNA formyltransferase [Desulfitibacteraceae bacterium MK1]